MLTREQALEIYQAGPEAVVKMLCEFSRAVDGVEKLKEEVVKLRCRVKDLEEQLSMNSKNSNKPPSSDGFNKPSPRSLRPKGKHPRGGQKGHPGHTLKMLKNPNHIVKHSVDECEFCGKSLADEDSESVEKRQVFDIKPIEMEVTEHRAEIKPCPNCGQINKGKFPEGVNAPVQYGPLLKGIAVYSAGYHLMPYKRLCEYLSDVFGLDISAGTLVNIVNRCSEQLKETVENIRQRLIRSPVVHFDETGMSIDGKGQWLHVAGDTVLTYYQVHPKRGTEAMDAIGILPEFKGRAIHDFWRSYLGYDCEHGLCNSHHLRELIFLHEEQDQRWAARMKNCLLAMKDAVDKARRRMKMRLPKKQICKLEARYNRVLHAGYRENPLPRGPTREKRTRGRPKKSKALNLLDRFRDYNISVLAFMYDLRVPFDNNLAERDIRMMKVKQKISGTFRSGAGAESFCRIRSYISTVRKNGLNAIDAIVTAIDGKPIMPSIF